MNINPIASSLTISGKTQNKNTTQSDTAASYNQTLNLEAGKLINLGTLEGKNYNMQIFKDGGFEWSGSLSIKEPPSGSKVTPEQIAAANAAYQYTMPAYEHGEKVAAVVNYFYMVTQKNWPVSSFNESTITSGISSEDIKDALNHLDLDSNQPFTINGRTFSLQSGILEENKDTK